MKKVSIGVVALLTGFWFFGGDSEESEDDVIDVLDNDNHRPLTDRVWISHIPKHERDKFHAMLMLEGPQMGVFSKNSSYEGDWSAFEWRVDKRFTIKMLQDESEHTISAKVQKGPRCKGFDYCLVIKGTPRGPQFYGSMEDWVIEGHESFDAKGWTNATFFDK